MRLAPAANLKSATKRSADVDPTVSMARQAMYRFAALSFLDPQAGSWGRLNALFDDRLLLEAAALIRSLPRTGPPALGRGERPIEMLDPRLVLGRLPNSERALNAQYESTFGLLVSSNCPPYETEYINSKFAFQRSNTLADINGFYHAFGLTTADAHPERPDHVVLELEFMACVLGLERQAADEDSTRRTDRLQVCRDAQSRFLQEHLGWWVLTFAKLLAKLDPQGFYAAAGAFLAALIPAERALLRLPPASGSVRPSVSEPNELCDGCQIAG